MKGIPFADTGIVARIFLVVLIGAPDFKFAKLWKQYID